MELNRSFTTKLFRTLISTVCPYCTFLSRKFAAHLSVALAILTAMCGCSQDAHSESGENAAKVQKREVRKIVMDEKFLDHPFYLGVKQAKESLKKIEKIKDYTAILVKRERIKGKLYDYGYMRVKVRHEPFSVYLKFLSSPVGREVIYVEGKNKNKLITHTPRPPKGVKSSLTDIPAILAGTLHLQPTSILAMQGNRYPITKIGLKTMLKELIEVGEADMKYGSAEIKYYNNATINKKPVKAFRFIHSRQVPLLNNADEKYKFKFKVAEVFMDKETKLPVRYAAYQWPKEVGGKPVLVEEYTYLKLKTNVGLTDDDFDPNSEKYNYPKKNTE